MQYPEKRMRRLRRSQALRKLNQDIYITPSDLILPIFLDENLPNRKAACKEVVSMPGVFVHNIESAKKICEQAIKYGIPGVILFGIPKYKDESGSSGDNESAIVVKFIQEMKKNFGNDLVTIADLCLCEYTSHGHCGILTASGEVDNDLTLNRLAQFTSLYANTGVDIIAPSGMMDGMIQTIRKTLDKSNFIHTSILSYAVKYASAFYGPFRDAAQSTPSFGDRKSYQMPFNRRWEAMAEAELDVMEGADILMVKPAMPYIDIVQQLSQSFSMPVYAYQVSGEYSMIKYAGKQNVIDEKLVMIESLYSIKRAGATAIITYAALEIASEITS